VVAGPNKGGGISWDLRGAVERSVSKATVQQQSGEVPVSRDTQMLRKQGAEMLAEAL
jgi:hypothetical protein